MRDFLKNPYIIALLIISALLLSLMAYSAAAAGNMSIVQNVLGTIVSPLQKGASKVKNVAGDKLSYFTKFDALNIENTKLKEQLRTEQADTRQLEQLKIENEQLKKYIGLHDTHPSWKMEHGEVISREPGSYLSSFTIDKGTLHGVAVGNVVMTSEGFAGVVYEVGINFAKVSTVIEEGNPIGGIVSRTRDAGIVEGDGNLKKNGLCKLSLLPSEQSAAAGDVIETSGLGGMFPKGLVIGRVVEVGLDKDGISYYASVKPVADLKNLRDVMVITSYNEEIAENK
ncbi:MAG: rod shape-determining protein MreC [Bacillota bacterium]|nr:rod shape-determining protein MreC [Bacillota bacterium]